MALTGAARERFSEQAATCRRMGSPFTARVIEALADLLGPDTRFGRKLQDWPGDPRDDATPLRAASGIHALARRGDAALGPCFPPATASDGALAGALADAVAREDAFLAAWLDSPPQTNEIGRSAALLGGLLVVASETGAPIALWELGASAGLNLRLDRYRFDLAEPGGAPRAWGAEAATVRVNAVWSGPAEATPPLDAPLAIARRAGCDRAPLDPAAPADRERLAAYIWADQTERQARTAAALAAAATDGLRVAKADAGDWLAARLAEPAPPGIARVIQHTIFEQYLPEPTRRRLDALCAEAGAKATPETPLARVSMERDATRGSARVALRLWAGGRPGSDRGGGERVLGRAQFHGAWVAWGGHAAGDPAGDPARGPGDAPESGARGG